MNERSLRRRAFLAGVTLSLSAVFFTHDAARAQGGAPKADVLVIHAANVPGGTIDPQLANLRQLKNVPFNSYNSFKLLDTKSLPLVKSGPSIALKNGYNFSLSLSSVEGKQVRIVPSLSKTSTPNPLPEVSAKINEPFFVAGQSYEGGILIIAVTPR